MNTIPCKDCICLPICKQRYSLTLKITGNTFLQTYEGFSNLSKKCNLINQYIRINDKRFSTERTYELERFMKQ